jgi:hypothetical protein
MCGSVADGWGNYWCVAWIVTHWCGLVDGGWVSACLRVGEWVRESWQVEGNYCVCMNESVIREWVYGWVVCYGIVGGWRTKRVAAWMSGYMAWRVIWWVDELQSVILKPKRLSGVWDRKSVWIFAQKITTKYWNGTLYAVRTNIHTLGYRTLLMELQKNRKGYGNKYERDVLSTPLNLSGCDIYSRRANRHIHVLCKRK